MTRRSYSAALIPWGRNDLGVDTLPVQLDKLGHLWCQGFSAAWDLPEGTVHDLFTFPSEQGGMGYLQPVEVMTEVILQHIQKDLLHDDVMWDILMLEFQQDKTGCVPPGMISWMKPAYDRGIRHHTTCGCVLPNCYNFAICG